MKTLLFLTTQASHKEKFGWLQQRSDIGTHWGEYHAEVDYYGIVITIDTIADLHTIHAQYAEVPLSKLAIFIVFMQEFCNISAEIPFPIHAFLTHDAFKGLLNAPTEPKVRATPYISEGIFFKVKNRLEKILFDEIVWIQANDIYSIIKTTQARYLVSHTLREIEEKLVIFSQFQRIHRSHLVNLKKVEAIEDKNLLIEGEYLPIGQAYRGQLFGKLIFM